MAAALAKLAEQDAVAAEDARAALEWIAGEQGLALITQERIQNFCWYQLPVKWLIGIEGKLRVAEGLAHVLDLLQLPRYAAICRSQTTREILSAHEIGTAEGTAAFRRAAAALGIMPPGLPEFEWERQWASRRPQRGRLPPTSSRSPSPAAISFRESGVGRRASGNSCELTSIPRRPSCSARRSPR